MTESIGSWRRDSLRVDPIRLGGRRGRQPVLSLDSDVPIPDDAFAALLPEVIDTDRLLQELKLDSDEREYFLANKIEGVQRRRIALHLNWEPAKVERVRVRLQRRLRALRLRQDLNYDDFIIRGGSSSHLSYEHPLWPGHSVWTLTELNCGFVKVMAAELAGLFQATSAVENLRRGKVKRALQNNKVA